MLSSSSHPYYYPSSHNYKTIKLQPVNNPILTMSNNEESPNKKLRKEEDSDEEIPTQLFTQLDEEIPTQLFNQSPDDKTTSPVAYVLASTSKKQQAIVKKRTVKTGRCWDIMGEKTQKFSHN